MNLRQSVILSSLFHIFLIFLFSIAFLLPSNKAIKTGNSLIADLISPEDTENIIPSHGTIKRPLTPINPQPDIRIQPRIYTPSQPEIPSTPPENIPYHIPQKHSIPDLTEKKSSISEPSKIEQAPVENNPEIKTITKPLLTPTEKTEKKEIKENAPKIKTEKHEQQKTENYAANKPLPSIKEKIFDKGILGDIAKRKDKNSEKENIPLRDLKKEQPFSLRETLKDARAFTPQKGLTFDLSDLKFLLYNLKLKERIEHIWIYPPGAAARGISGDLIIRFTIKKDGKIGSIELVRTSGYKDLDDAALKALKEASPFWPLPESWGMESYTINGHFVYTIIYNL